MTYIEAKQEFEDLFGLTSEQMSAWTLSLNTGSFPLDAYKTFSTKEAAETFIAGRTVGGNIYYEIYSGAVISVINDSDPSNNGLYHVENNPDSNSSQKFVLVKVFTDEYHPGSGDSITVLEKDPIDTQARHATPYIYFVGVDSSTSPQNDVSTLYFNHGIVYDASGNMVLTASDTRLKDIKGDLDVDIDSLVNLDKVYFSWKQDPTHKQCIGVTAQSVEEAFPELVVDNPDTGYKMVNYAGLSVIALAAIDKLNVKYNDLEKRLHELEQKI